VDAVACIKTANAGKPAKKVTRDENLFDGRRAPSLPEKHNPPEERVTQLTKSTSRTINRLQKKQQCDHRLVGERKTDIGECRVLTVQTGMNGENPNNQGTKVREKEEAATKRGDVRRHGAPATPRRGNVKCI